MQDSPALLVDCVAGAQEPQTTKDLHGSRTFLFYVWFVFRELVLQASSLRDRQWLVHRIGFLVRGDETTADPLLR